jgi:transcriptional regulator with XRE-family HTH domain
VPHSRKIKDQERLLGFGDRLRTIRLNQGYTQEKMAEMAGFTRSYYTEIESGKRNIALLNIIKILEILEINANDLISGGKNER